MLKDMYVHLPKVKPNRSKFIFKPKNYTTLNVGDLCPLYKPVEVIPGDTFKVKTGSLLELTPMVSMVYDSLFFDVFWFYVPFRLLWSEYKYFYGENKQDPYDSIGVYSIPQVIIPKGGYNVGTIANYFGIRPGVGSTTDNDITISALPFRAYASIVNEFFIADYINSKANTNYDISATVEGSNGNDYVTDLVLGGKPFVSAKLHDRFTSALPKPQAGESVPLPLGGTAPVFQDQGQELIYDYSNQMPISRIFEKQEGTIIPPSGDGTKARNLAVSGTGYIKSGSTYSSGYDHYYTIPNVYTDLSSASATTINNLRQAVIVQHMLEAESRHGNRYFEQLVGDYGVTNDDLTLGRPEYLGGSRFSLNVNPVVQTSESNNTPQGNMTSYSITTFSHTDFTKSFKEPGYLIVLGTIRYPHSYPQGLDKLWKKKDKYDFYNQHFEGMGEQPIYNHEIFFSGSSSDDDVFGYTPYGTEYRDLENMATGEMSPDYSQPLTTYHYADDYQTTPALSPEWLKEDVTNVDRTLTYPHSTVANFRCNFSFKITAYRPLSVYGLPGLRWL